jgi:hypothetical protein
MQSSRWCIGYDRAANDARPRWINARRPVDLIGKLVAEVAARCRAEPAICVPLRAWHGPVVGRLFSACHAVA